MVMRISRVLLDRLIAEAVAAPDREICGLLLGNAEEILEATPAANVSSNPHDSFEIDPQALVDAHRAERQGGPCLIGYYHSHPTGLAQPSATDRAQASGDGRIWAIIGGGDVTLWRDVGGGFEHLFYQVVAG